MTHPTNEFDETTPPSGTPGPTDASDDARSEEWDDVQVDEETPDGGAAQGRVQAADSASSSEEDLDDEEAPEVEAGEDDDPPPDLVWYVLKVQSSREDTIAEALQRRVKIQGLERFFGVTPEGKPRVVVPTEKITEIRNNKKRIVERKTYPGYIMVHMELNEKTWFLVRETPGVGDFVGAHGTPTKMTEAEVNQMLNHQEEQTTAKAPTVRIDVERGDRVKIKDGPFENFEGTVEEVIEGRGLVKVMLIIFNRPTPVDLEYWQLERL